MAHPPPHQQGVPYTQPGSAQYQGYSQQAPPSPAGGPAYYHPYPPPPQQQQHHPQQPPFASSPSYGQLPAQTGWPQQPPAHAYPQQQQYPAHGAAQGVPAQHQQQYPAYGPPALQPYPQQGQAHYQQAQQLQGAPPRWYQQPQAQHPPQPNQGHLQQPSGFPSSPPTSFPSSTSVHGHVSQGHAVATPPGVYTPPPTVVQGSISYSPVPGSSAYPPSALPTPGHRWSISNPPTSSYASPSPPTSATSTPPPSAGPAQRTHSRAGSQPRYPTQKPPELSPLPSGGPSSVSLRHGASSRHLPGPPVLPTPPTRASTLPAAPGMSGSAPSSSYHIPTSSSDLHRSQPSPRPLSPQPSPLSSGVGRPLPSPLPNGVPPPKSSPSPLPSMRPASPLASPATPTPTPPAPTRSAGGRPLPRPPGGVLPSKSLDRGTMELNGGRPTSGGQWASLIGAPAAGGPAGGIARASTLPPLPRPITIPSDPVAPQGVRPQSPAPLPNGAASSGPPAAPPTIQLPVAPAPPVIVVPEIVLPTVPSISVDPFEDLTPKLAQTTISPRIITPPSDPAPRIGAPTTPTQKGTSFPAAPFIIPTFSFPEDPDEPSSPAHSPSSPGPKISFSSPGKSEPPQALVEQPAIEAKSSTAVVESERHGRPGEIVCEACGETLLGRLVSGNGGKFWHPKCFKCTTCNLLLEHVSSFEHEGQLYCHLDYHELFTTRCYTCKTPIVDERFFTINDPSLGTPRYYHELHFFCSECGDPFLDPHRSSSAGTEKLAHARRSASDENEEDLEAMTANINLFKGHPYCDGCHIKLHAPKCKGCRKPIAGEMLEALGGKWHAECLKCESCDGPFEGLRIFEHEGMGLCEGCFSLLLKADS